MFLLLPLITLITSFKSIFSLKNKIISNCNLQIIQNYSLLTINEPNEANCDCLPSDLNNITNSTYINIIICTLKCWKNHPTKFEDFAINLRGIIPLSYYNMTNFILNITKKIVNNGTIIDQFVNLLSKNRNFTDLMIEILNRPEDLKNISKINKFFYRLTNIEGILELFIGIYNSSREDFLDLVQEMIKNLNKEKLAIAFKFIREKMGEQIDDVIFLIYKMFKYYNNKNQVFKEIGDFIMEHNNTYDKIKEILMDDAVIDFIRSLINTENPIFLHVFNIIFPDKKILGLILDILRNDISLQLTIKILPEINNIEHIKENFGKLASNIVKVNSSMLEPVTEFFIDLMCNSTKANATVFNLTLSSFQDNLVKLFKTLNYTSYNFTEDCIELLRYTYFDSSKKDKSLFFLYMQKYIFDSSRNKGDFLPFDNCMNNNQNIPGAQIYNITPAYIIGIINEEEEKKDYKNSSFYFKYNFLKGYCFPFGYKNKTAKDKDIPMCTDKDYKKVFFVLNNFYSSKMNIDIETINITKSNIVPKSLNIFLGILGILILALPILIYIFLLISGHIIANQQKKINEINEKEKNPKMNKNELIEVNSKKIKNKIIYPRWYQYLNECFDLKKNLKELFNFSFNNTNYNNFKGMTYIKGTVGIFIILTVFGQTFVALLNLPTRNYGLYDYYLMMKNPLYLFLYIGYRYSPRILFSCSGYSLIYKYLCYIEQEQRLYFLKFVFLQSYKYIFLALSIVFFKYLLYDIVFFISYTKRPLWEVFKHFITLENNFIKRFLSLLVYFREEEDILKTKLIFYFYIPINEVLFFILGTVLISLGYKFKLRIDIIIFVLMLLVYILKIILINIKQDEKTKSYITIDYYLFDYGLTIHHPLFNLNYFLIGMFFGLINYTIQKGITDLEEKNNYQNIILLSDSKVINDEDENQKIRHQSTFSLDKTNVDLIDLNINNDSNILDSMSTKSNNNKILKRTFTISSKKNEDQRIKDIKYENNEDLETFFLKEDENSSKSIEYSEKVKKMPFLIWPIKFSNFHKKNKNKLIINLFIIIAFFLLLLFMNAQFLFTIGNLKADMDKKNIVDELSFRKVIPKLALNIIFSLDIEIAIFLIQWINFILYFKEVGIIKNFLNHVYWSFFVKTYFSFNIISVTVILCIFFINENVIKFNFANIFLYICIDIVFIFICTIAVYCCFELPFKKIFKFFLKGKESLNNEENEGEYYEEEKSLKDDDDYKIY